VEQDDTAGGQIAVAGRYAEEVLVRERFGLNNLGGVRNQVRQASLAAGLSPELAENLTTATSEGMTNAIVHGGAVRTVTVSVIENVGVVAEVHDDGHAAAFRAPAVAPPPDQEGGRGLLLACALCDRVSVTTGRDGTVVLLEVDYRR
jgi:anti-sigma regulatory factor (Ser/Thr protein kinase)